MTESNDKQSYHINSDKINQVLGFKAKRSIEDGIKDLYLYFKKNVRGQSE